MSDVDNPIKDYSAFLASNTLQIDLRHQLYRRVQDAFGALSSKNWWRYREASRFIHFQYEPILPDDELWQEQIVLSNTFLSTFPHRAKNEPMLISWTPSDEYGLQDRRVVGKPGRMLSVMYGCSEITVSNLVNRANQEAKPAKLCFAETLEMMRHAYTTGPTSCMSKSFKALRNPIAVYATPHLRVAYLQQPETGRVTARCLVRVDRTPNQYTRIYGNEFALRKQLHEQGYVLAKDGLLGIQLAAPHETLSDSVSTQSTLHIAYIDAPAQWVEFDVVAGTITVVMGPYPSNSTSFVLAAIDASGNVKIPSHWLRAWKERDPTLLRAPPTKRKLPRFANAQQDDDDNVLCSNCDEFYPDDEVVPDIDRMPVCDGCRHDHYVEARNTDGDYRLVNNDSERLRWVECMEDYCVDCSPTDVFDVVEDTDSGEYIRAENAIWSEIQDGYIHSDAAISVYSPEADDSDQVSDDYLSNHMDNVLIAWSKWPAALFPTDITIYLLNGSRFNEQRQTILEEAAEAHREPPEERRFQTVPELVAEFAGAIYAASTNGNLDSRPSYDQCDTIGDFPGCIQALIRESVSRMEAAARSDVPRAAA